LISEITMPSMGADMTEGTIVKWLKNEGDKVSKGDKLAEIETDKTVVEMESYNEGILKKILAKEGTKIGVGKTIAYIGIIGLPNAGKSSLLAAITSATPKIANYKFTTLSPNLGVAIYDDKEITLADIPGLIEGAHTGVGLGIKFLKHIERCKTLLHMIDITTENLETSYNQVRKELGNYNKDLLTKDELVILNKTDLLDEEEINKKKEDFSKNKKLEVFTLSILDKNSISNIKSKLIKYVS